MIIALLGGADELAAMIRLDLRYLWLKLHLGLGYILVTLRFEVTLRLRLHFGYT